MISLNDFDSERRFTSTARAREERLLEAEVRLGAQRGENPEQLSSFLEQAGTRYLTMADKAKTMLPYEAHK